MRTQSIAIPLAAVLALGSFSAEAAQRDRHERGSRSEGQQRSRGDDSGRQRGDRGSRSSDQSAQRSERRGRDSQAQSQDSNRQAPQAAEAPREQRESRGSRDEGRASRYRGGSPESAQRDAQQNNDRNGSASARSDDRSSYGSRDNNYRNSDQRRGDNRGRYDNDRSNDRNRAVPRTDYSRGSSYRGRDNDRYNDRGYYRGGSYSRYYYAPRHIDRRPNYRRYYGSGGHLSLYFGIGSGYRYGSPYSGRVYGYRRGIATYGNYVAYGDLRLKISPRDAQVYVDGYYAGLVDDFDGFFQRLTLEVGPHEIEVVAPGGESEFYDVYVDPNNTVDLHGDLER